MMMKIMFDEKIYASRMVILIFDEKLPFLAR